MSNNNYRLFYIYEITNNVNGKTYIGQRFCPLNCTPETDERYMGSGKLLWMDYTKYSTMNFSKTILAICGTRKQADILERTYIKLYREMGKAEYNIADGGNGGDLGKEARKNTKQKLEEYWNSERGLRQRAINSEIQKNREDAWTKGKHWYNDGMKNVCAKECPEGFVPGRLGDFTCTEEMKEKKRQAMRNMSPEKKAEMSKHLSESKKGKKLSESCKENIGNANRGRKYFNNGEIEVMRFECPPGFVPGRCPKAKSAISKGMR